MLVVLDFLYMQRGSQVAAAPAGDMTETCHYIIAQHLASSCHRNLLVVMDANATPFFAAALEEQGF
jgi:hypothetical protein